VATSLTPPGQGTPTGTKKPAGTLYRGREGMWSWVMHRISGVLIFFFLFVHVLDTATVRVSPEVYNGVIAQYKNPVMGLGEAGLVGAVVFHALNGIRKLFWGVVVLWAVLMAGFLPRHLMIVFGH
jgi:succinate dehydrogenase / fumarate reductase cytochrome b subunit